VAADPAIVDLFDRQRTEVVPAHPSLAFHDDQVCAFENAEVLHHRATVELGKAPANVAGGQRLDFQEIEDPAPAPV
jgi:hypothetical protein